jgi:hypothetical protein
VCVERAEVEDGEMTRKNLPSGPGREEEFVLTRVMRTRGEPDSCAARMVAVRSRPLAQCTRVVRPGPAAARETSQPNSSIPSCF